MHVHVMCPACGKVFSAPQQLMGKALRCTDCDELIPIPQQPWYYRQKDNILGPVSPGVLRWLAREGEIWPDTLIRRGETGKWVAAGGVSGLFESLRDAPPPAHPDAPA